MKHIKIYEAFSSDANDEYFDREAPKAFGKNVGLNADWMTSAYMLSPGKPNQTDGAFYLTDNEDGTYSIMKRNDVKDQDIEEVAQFDAPKVAIEKAKEFVESGFDVKVLKVDEAVTQNRNWKGGITQRKEVRAKLEDLAKKIDAVFASKKKVAKVELFDSGYSGISIEYNGAQYYVFDQPGKVGLEDQSMPYIKLTKDSKQDLVNIGPDYHSRGFGHVQMDDDMREDAYNKILDWFKANVK